MADGTPSPQADGHRSAAPVDMRDVVEAVGDALTRAAAGAFEQPTRLVLDDGTLLVMTAAERGSGDAVVKIVRVDVAAAQGKQAINGLVLWTPRGGDSFTIDGGELTALRTGAVAGYATDVLAAPDAHRLAVIGAGRQAAAQVEAMCAVRPIDQVTIASRTRSRAHDLADRLSAARPHLDVRVVAEPRSAVGDADIVCCATTATSPLFAVDELPTRVHVNAIGSYRPGMRELPRELLLATPVLWVDDVAGCLEESGEIVDALAHGLDLSAIRPINENARSRTPSEARTVFKSVGCAVLDWAAASMIARRALAEPVGR